ncbi:MAG: ATP-dependent helicase HrpB, partial [Chromatiales bacterium]|nr:ATP-dependent helicase HrpB [Chromatiales bacterium]
PPGAGKTTGVPLALLDEPWLAGRSILMLEPRRLAARAAAGRMARLRGEEVGETIGYQIRFEGRSSARTRIKVVTEGILTRQLQFDPELRGIGLVIFDEFHERHLHADLALALCLDAQRGLREDLRILVMSATLDGEAVAALLGDAPIITSAGRSFPVDVRYLARDVEGPLPQAASAAIRRALAQEEGDVLAFLPGAWEIRRTQELLHEECEDEIEILPLHGDLPWDAQDRALRSAGKRRVVLATPIAETSLTIEGVRIVVDAGYVRVPHFDPVSGLSRLTTQRISRASADQRAGRAGRTAPGVCLRLWSDATQRRMSAHGAPEIATADLAPLALELAAWGVNEVAALSWLDPPPAAAFAQARELLSRLGALDAAGRITEIGRAMVKLPLHPRLAHMMFVAQRLSLGDLASDIAALLSEHDIFTGAARRSVDFTQRIEALRASAGSNGRRAAQAYGADHAACQRVALVARQYRGLLSFARVDASATGKAQIANARSDDLAHTGLLLAFAYPDRIALQRAPGDHRYLLASGRGARFHEKGMRLRDRCIVTASLDAGETEGMIHLAAPVDIDELRAHPDVPIHEEDAVRYDAQQQAVIARREVRLGALVLGAQPLSKVDTEQLRAAMIAGIRRLGLDALPWTRTAREWQARVLSLRAWLPEEEWPDVSDAALLATLEDWLAPFLDGVTRRDHLARLDLAEILASRLDWQTAQRLEQIAPTHLTVPSGSRHRLEYTPGESPVLRVKLQEMFGRAETPRIAAGRVPVTLHLLSPAQRPIQVTQDLRGFWERTYAEVKKELKGRYPKHPWPDDPWGAAPTGRAKKRGE